MGQAPGPRGNNLAFDGPSGDRLAERAGLRGRRELRAAFRLANILPRFPGKAKKGDLFPRKEAKLAAGLIRLSGTVLLAGKSVGSAFGLRGGYFEWSRIGSARVAIVPHPSGVNRWWNDAANAARAEAFLRGVLIGESLAWL